MTKPVVRLQNDIIDALKEYADRLMDDSTHALKAGSREEAACMKREQRKILKLRASLTKFRDSSVAPEARSFRGLSSIDSLEEMVLS